MDNDNKVRASADKADTHKSVRLFLAKELKTLEQHTQVQTYNLIDEYAKTRQNHNRFVWLLLMLCFVTVGGISLAITLYVSRQNTKIEINIDSFDDLNLRSLLSSVGRTQNMYENATKEKASLQASLDSELKQAEQKRDNDLFTMQSVAAVSTPAAMKRKAEAVEKEYEATVQRLHEEYDTLIQTAENEIQQYSSQLDTYDGAKISRAQEQEAAIDSQRQLHDLEMKQQAFRYEAQIAELRLQMAAQQQAAKEAQRAAVEEVRRVYQARIDELDPFVRDAHGNSVVRKAAAENASAESFTASDYRAGSGKTAQTLTDALVDTEAAFTDFDYITRIVADIPQERDIPSFVHAMKNKTYEIGSTLARAAQSLQQQADALRDDVSRLQEQVAARDSFIDAYISENLCDGAVLSVANRSALPLRLTSAAAARVAAGEATAQIREGKKVIADVTIQKTDDGYSAVPTNALQAERITVFAKLYLVSETKK